MRTDGDTPGQTCATRRGYCISVLDSLCALTVTHLARRVLPGGVLYLMMN